MALNEQEEFELLSLERERAQQAATIHTDKRRLTDPQRLEVLRAQLTDPHRNPAFDSELKAAIARMETTAGVEPEYPAVEKFVPSGEQPLPSLTDPEAIAGAPATRFALGAASPVLGTLQIGGQISDKLYELTGIPYRPGEALSEYISRLEDMKRSGRAQIGSEGIDFIESLGLMFSPAFLAAFKIPAATTFLGKVAQGAATGAAAGATAPITDGTEDFAEKKAGQVKTGAAFGAGVSAVAIPASKVARMVYHGLIEPWAAPAAIKGRAFLEAAGDKADDIIALLRSPEELVPGSKPTAGQAAVPAGRAEFSALQRSAEGVRPSDYVARADEQNAARIAQVRTVGKDKAALAAAEGARAGKTSALYQEAYETAVRADPELATLFQNPYIKDAVPDALRLAKAAKISPKENLTRFLHYVKIGLDKQLTRTGDTALSATEQRAVQAAKKELTDWLGRKNPAYDAARATFAEESAPINQMEIGQYLEKKLVPALSDEAKQSAVAYSNALRDAPQTIKKATGGPRFDELTQILAPDQMSAVQSVQDDLARLARGEMLAQKGAKAGPNAVDLATQNLQDAFGGKVPNILNRVALAANAIISRVEGKINKKLAAEIAAEMLNPQAVGESMAKAQARAKFNARLAEDAQKMLRQYTLWSAHQRASEEPE